jgi:glycopeptide antibiotics resistance protein
MRKTGQDASRSQTAARWLTLATCVLILYGSLFPFSFSSLRSVDLWALVTGLQFIRSSRGDVVANVLLYLPLGYCLTLSWPARWKRGAGLACAVLLGAMLSLGVELLQAHLRFRVPSLTDLIFNAAGTGFGALAALVYLGIGSTIHIPGIGPGRPDPVPFVVIGLWLAYRLAPFVPTIDWQKYKDALKPLLLAPELAAFDVFRYVVGWLAVGFAVQKLWRRDSALYALAALVAMVMVGRIMVVGKTLSASEAVALAACIPITTLVAPLAAARRATLVAALLGLVILIAGLSPFVLGAPHSFSWVPFMGSLSNNLELNTSALLEKTFWCFALIWLMTQCGAGIVAATIVTAVLLALIEVLQIWIPGRSAEITDPLLAVGSGAMLAVLSTQSARRTSTARFGGLQT